MKRSVCIFLAAIWILLYALPTLGNESVHRSAPLSVRSSSPGLQFSASDDTGDTSGFPALPPFDRPVPGSRDWWLEMATTFSFFDPVNLDMDVRYGRFLPRTETFDHNGWLLSIRASCHLDILTPSLGFWVAGNQAHHVPGAESHVFERLYSPFNEQGLPAAASLPSLIANDAPDTAWGMSLALENVSILNDLSHVLQFAVANGTGTHSSNLAMGEDDWLFEITMASRYLIYENLSAIAEFGWATLYLDQGGHREDDNQLSDAWEFGLGLQYSF